MAKAKKGKLTIEDALVPVEEQPYEIPENWCWTKLKYAIETSKEKTESFDEADLKYVGLEHIEKDGGIIGYDSAEEIKSLKNVFHKNQILYGKLRPYLNKHDVASFDGVCSTDILVFDVKSIVDNKFVNFFFNQTYFIDYAVSNSNGINLPRVSENTVLEVSFPLPPLAEQKLIVEQIEKLFSKLDEAKEKVSDALSEFENRKAAIMHSAFSGKLTREWRKNRGISDNTWQHVTMGDIAKFHQGVQVPVDEQYDECDENRIRFIRIVDYTQGNEPARYISNEKVTKDTIVTGNEIVMVRYGASAGFVGDGIEGVIANNMFTITVDDSIRKYIKLYLKSPHMYKLLNTSGGSSAMPALNFKVVSRIELDIPSLAEIEQIYKVLNPVIETYEKTESIYINVIEQIDLMKKSILAKAFRGELGTNNPEEENAVQLLERIIGM